MRVLMVLTLLALTACGVDGDPIRPAANVGVTITPEGISPNVSVGARQGPFSVGVDL